MLRPIALLLFPSLSHSAPIDIIVTDNYHLSLDSKEAQETVFTHEDKSQLKIRSPYGITKLP